MYMYIAKLRSLSTIISNYDNNVEFWQHNRIKNQIYLYI